MADPVKRPLTWSKAFPIYAEKHDMYRVLQELLKELIISKPTDPLLYIRDELHNVVRLLHCPRVFIIGPNVVSQGIGRSLAGKCGAKFLTISDIVDASPASVKNILTTCITETKKKFDDNVRKLMVSTIKLRLRQPDCLRNGYILYGFPQNQWQAKAAQQNGLIPRGVFVFLPNPDANSNSSSLKLKTDSGSGTNSPSHTFLSPPTSASDKRRSESTMTKTQYSFVELTVSQVREVADCYDPDLCKIFPYEKWANTRKKDLEGELLSNIVSLQPCGSPFIPKILIIGPPYSGRSTVADALTQKFEFANVDMIELIRGATNIDDEIGKACKKYLSDLQPMNDEMIKKLLQRRLTKIDCERKGWVLHSFPDLAKQLHILDALQCTPNRVFFLYCPQDYSESRYHNKRSEVLSRRLSGDEGKTPSIDEQNFEIFPFGRNTFWKRFDMFASEITEISSFYGSKMIYVDATQKIETVIRFMEESVLRPPIVRFPDPTASAMKAPHHHHHH